LFEFYLKKATDSPEIGVFFKRAIKMFFLITLFLTLLVPVVVAFLKLRFSPSLILFLLCIFSISALVVYKTKSIGIRDIPVYVTLVTGLIFLSYTDLDLQRELRKDNYPRKIAHEINLLLPDEAHTVYEMGYRRFLGITCYLNKDVVQLDRFTQLQSLIGGKERTYFIFDTDFMNSRNDKEKKALLQEIRWEKVYSKYLEESRDEIVVGVLKGK
ncbi:MAG: hypothetical protein AB1442_05115, partial [Nitrospirota bacterium]